MYTNLCIHIHINMFVSIDKFTSIAADTQTHQPLNSNNSILIYYNITTAKCIKKDKDKISTYQYSSVCEKYISVCF
jgi:hypothetical protein